MLYTLCKVIAVATPCRDTPTVQGVFDQTEEDITQVLDMDIRPPAETPAYLEGFSMLDLSTSGLGFRETCAGVQSVYAFFQLLFSGLTAHTRNRKGVDVQ